MSDALLWRQTPPRPLSAETIADLTIRIPRPVLTPMPRTTAVLQTLEIGLLFANSPQHSTVTSALELQGRGYQRVAAGPMIDAPDPLHVANALVILWPRAPVDWGSVRFIALFQPGSDVVLASCPVPNGIFAILAGDQARIPVGALKVSGVEADQTRPFGIGPFGRSVFGGWPPEGDIFTVALSDIGYAWDWQRDTCGPWTPAVAYSGGCENAG